MNSETTGVNKLHKIIINKNYRSKLKSELSYYGINSATLFPDLDGISKHINWTIESREYWNIPINGGNY